MNKKSLKQELNLIKKSLKNFPNGAFIAEIKANLAIDINPRTLQRRLARLIQTC